MFPMFFAFVLGGVFLVCSVIDAVLTLRGCAPEALTLTRVPARGHVSPFPPPESMAAPFAAQRTELQTLC